MCFSYSVNFNADALKSRMQLEDLILPESGYFFSAFTWPHLPVIVGEKVKLKSCIKQWGLIPGWCKDEQQSMELRKLALNAKGETISEKPMFRNAFKNGRCLIPAAGFFEWRDVNKKKYPYYIYPSNNSYFLFAGISESWLNKNTGEIVETYAIVTSPANRLLSKIHNTKLRMPLILSESDGLSWIGGTETDAGALVKPYSDELMTSHTISRLVSNPKGNRNVAEIQEPCDYPELEEHNGNLFGW